MYTRQGADPAAAALCCGAVFQVSVSVCMTPPLLERGRDAVRGRAGGDKAQARTGWYETIGYTGPPCRTAAPGRPRDAPGGGLDPFGASRRVVAPGVLSAGNP